MCLRYASVAEGQETRPECFVFLYQVKIPTRINTQPPPPPSPEHRNQGIWQCMKTNYCRKSDEFPLLGDFDFLYMPRKINTRAMKSSKHKQKDLGHYIGFIILLKNPFKTMGKLKFCCLVFWTFVKGAVQYFNIKLVFRGWNALNNKHLSNGLPSLNQEHML